MDLYHNIKDAYGLKDVVPEEMAPLILAHIGDAVYEVVIRTMVLSKGNRPIEKVHRDATGLVNAGVQARVADTVQPVLTEDELNIYKRGRNAKSGSKAKNASIGDYRKATGLETLVGYLYLKGETDRILFLINEGLKDAKK